MASDSPENPTFGSDIHHWRNRLAGLWAAELLGLIGHAATDYTKSVIHPGHDPEAPHGDDAETVIGKLVRDLEGRVSASEVREKMAHFLAEAKRQLKKDVP